MSKLTELTVTELLESFAAPAPTPGGGSAAALAGALGASLLMMVAGLPRTRGGTDTDRAALDDVLRQLRHSRDHLANLMDRDRDARLSAAQSERAGKAGADCCNSGGASWRHGSTDRRDACVPCGRARRDDRRAGGQPFSRE